MSAAKDGPGAPDVDRLVRSMLLLYGAHHDGPAPHRADEVTPKLAKLATNVAADPHRAAALSEATRHDRERYLTSGLQPVDCRFCHVSVLVKKLGPGHTSVQWNSDATGRCAYFTEVRKSGGDTARSKACPRLADSIDHAVAEGVLEQVSTAPAPGDG